MSTKEAGQLFAHAQYRIMAKKWILPKLMWAVDQKPGYNLEWPKLVHMIPLLKVKGHNLHALYLQAEFTSKNIGH